MQLAETLRTINIKTFSTKKSYIIINCWDAKSIKLLHNQNTLFLAVPHAQEATSLNIFYVHCSYNVYGYTQRDRDGDREDFIRNMALLDILDI